MSRKALLALATTAALISACGSDGDGDSTEEAATGSAGQSAATTAAKPTGPPIKIMTSVPVNAPTFAYPEVIPTVEAGIDRINKDGGINGSPLEFIPCDNGLNVNKASQCARKAQQEGVAALVGTYALAASPGLFPTLEAANIPTVAISPSAPLDWTSKMSYPIVGDPFTYVGGVIGGLQRVGCKKISILGYDDKAYDPYFAMSETAAKHFGVPTERVRVPLTTTDFASAIAKVVGNGSDCIQLQTGGSSLPPIYRAVKASGKDLRIGLNQPTIEPHLASLGKQLDGTVVGAPVITPTIDPANDAPDLMKRYAEDMKAAGITEPKELSVSGFSAWLGLQLVKQAAETLPAGEVDGKSLAAALDTTVFDSGVAGPTDFSKPGPLKGLDRLKNFELFVKEVEDGKIVMTDPTPISMVEAFQGLDFNQL